MKTILSSAVYYKVTESVETVAQAEMIGESMIRRQAVMNYYINKK